MSFFKPVRLISDMLRETCRGQACQLMLAPKCSNPETTVPCHIQERGHGGMGTKPSDFFIADGCSACHDILDGRVKTTRYTDDEIELIAYRAMRRKQQSWIDKGIFNKFGRIK